MGIMEKRTKLHNSTRNMNRSFDLGSQSGKYRALVMLTVKSCINLNRAYGVLSQIGIQNRGSSLPSENIASEASDLLGNICNGQAMVDYSWNRPCEARTVLIGAFHDRVKRTRAELTESTEFKGIQESGKRARLLKIHVTLEKSAKSKQERR